MDLYSSSTIESFQYWVISSLSRYKRFFFSI